MFKVQMMRIHHRMLVYWYYSVLWWSLEWESLTCIIKTFRWTLLKYPSCSACHNMYIWSLANHLLYARTWQIVLGSPICGTLCHLQEAEPTAPWDTQTTCKESANNNFQMQPMNLITWLKEPYSWLTDLA